MWFVKITLTEHANIYDSTWAGCPTPSNLEYSVNSKGV